MSVYFKKFVGSFNMKRNSGEAKTNNDRAQNPNEDSLILSLPKEMLVEIFVNIPVGNLLSVMLTCKGFCEATNESILWQRKFFFEFGCDTTPLLDDQIKNDWKLIFKTETEMRWDTLCCNPSFRICNHQRTAYKEHHKDWNNTHSNVRTTRGFSAPGFVYTFLVHIDHCDTAKGGFGMGLVDDAADSNIVSNPTRSYLGSWSSCLNYGYYNNGYISSGDYATTMGYNVGDVIGFELDKQKGELRFFKNGKQQGAGIKNPRFCDNSELYPALDFANVGDKMTIHKVTKKKTSVR